MNVILESISPANQSPTEFPNQLRQNQIPSQPTVMSLNKLNKRFIVIKKDVLFVPGPINGAIYDLSNKRLYHLDERLTKILTSSREGLSIEEAMKGAGIANEKEIKIILDTLLGISCISVEEESQPFLDIKIQKSPARPRVAWLEPTDRCNLFCVHCYAESRLSLNDKELSTEKWLSIINELDEIGIEQIVFTGGEPLLRPDFFNLLSYASTKNSFHFIQILTNGTLITSSPLLDLIAEKRIGVGLSFYSYTPEIHDRVTRNPGSWKKTVEGISLLVNKGTRPSANIVMTTINQDDVEETRNFLVSLGVKDEDIMSNVVLPTGRGCHSDYQVRNYDHLIRKSYVLEDRFGRDGWRDHLGTCWRGKFAIKANGTLIPCTMCREIELGDVSNKPLADIINDGAFDRIWDIDFDSTTTCSECELRYACRDCRALTYAFTGDLCAKDPTCPYDPYTGDATGIFFPNPSRSSPISHASKPKRRSDIVQTRVEGGLFISDRNACIHHHLNPVAGEIWELLDGDHTIEAVVNIIGQRFEKQRPLLEHDIFRIVERLIQLGLIEHGL